jgi:hypothetical protein
MEWGQEVGSSETVMKIVMLTIVASLAAGCAPLHPSGCHKTTALGSCGSGVGRIRMHGGRAGNQGGDQCQT